MNAVMTEPTVARSQSAARPSASRAIKASNHEVLSFNLGQEHYGIDILLVQEIRGHSEPTRIAGSPRFVKGVMNLRGTIVPIIDLRLMFDMPDAIDASTVTIVLNVSNRVVGIIVDGVSDVRTLNSDSLKPAPQFNSRIDADFIKGLASLGQGDGQSMLVVLDIERLVRSPDIGLTFDAQV